MGVNVAAHTRHIFLGSSPGGVKARCTMLYLCLSEFSLYILHVLWHSKHTVLTGAEFCLELYNLTLFGLNLENGENDDEK